jgi:hypothetical protein
VWTRDRAIVGMGRGAYEGLISAAEIFRSHPLFANRGCRAGIGIPDPALVERGNGRLFRKFDAQLQRHPFVAANASPSPMRPRWRRRFCGVHREKVPDECANLRRWHAEVSKRPVRAPAQYDCSARRRSPCPGGKHQRCNGQIAASQKPRFSESDPWPKIKHR